MSLMPTARQRYESAVRAAESNRQLLDAAILDLKRLADEVNDLRSQLANVSAGPWVSVAERTPDLAPLEPGRSIKWSASVLVWGPSIGPRVAQRWRINEDPPIDGWADDDGNEFRGLVVSWAPINPPSAEVKP